MPRQSAGLVMYRRRQGRLEIFLVHPGGPFWAKKDLGAWSIPKGEYQTSEEPLEVAKREFLEETGFEATGEFVALTPIRQAGGKKVTAFAFEGDCDPSLLTSNTFTMEWPPRSGKEVFFPEVDRGEWFEIGIALEKLIPSQATLLEELRSRLSIDGETSHS